MAAPGTFFDPTNPFKSIVGPTWAGSPPVPPVAGAGQRRMFRPLASSVKMGVGAVLPGGGTGMVVSTPPPAFGGVGGGRSGGGGGGFHADMGEHFNQKWDPDAHGPGVGGYVPVKVDATPGDGPAPNANPGMGLIQPLPPIFPQPDGAAAPPVPAVGNPANNNAQDAAGRIAANMRGFKSGGTTEPGETVMVGEQGPELAKGNPDGSVSVLPHDLLREAGGVLEVKPGSPYLGKGPNFSTGFDVYDKPPPAPSLPTTGVGGDMPPEPSGLGMSVPRTGTLPPPPIAPAPSAEQLLTPPTGKTGGMYDVTGSASNLLGPPASVAPPRLFAAPEAYEGGGGNAAQSGEDVRSDAFSYLHNPPQPGAAINPNAPPPGPRMGQIPAPWTPEAQQNRNPIVDKWNAGRNSIREDTAIRRFNRNHPLAGPTMDLQREAKRAEVNREAEKFNIEQFQKDVETARKTAHNIAQEKHWDDTVRGRDAVETAKLKQQAQKDHEKKTQEAAELSDALGQVQTRAGMIPASDPDHDAKVSLLQHIAKQKTAKGVAAGVKYYDETYPRAPKEATIGGHHGTLDSHGFKPFPNPPAQSAKKIEDQRAHYWSE